MDFDPYKTIDDGLKWHLVTLALAFAAVYLIRLNVQDARERYELQRVRAAKAENDLDGALETIHELKSNGTGTGSAAAGE